MKAFCVSFALISSLFSVNGCSLETTCKGKAFQNCIFEQSCRNKEALNLQNKALSGVIPVKFYFLIGRDVNGIPADGIPAVKIKKLYMQNNALTGSLQNLFAPTIQEINVEGNPFTSTQQIDKPSNALLTLNLAATSQTDVKWLQNKAPNLKTLNLANNQISDISPLVAMKKLTSLDLRGNKQITDLSPLVEIPGLKDIKVDAPLQQQASIIASTGSEQTKRSQLVSAEIGDVQKVAVGNQASIEEIKRLTSTIPELTDKNQKLESRIIILEQKLAQLNQACFASSNTGNRRQLNSGCVGNAVSSSATATLSLATMASAAWIFL